MDNDMRVISGVPSGATGLAPERPNVLITSVGRRTYLVRWFQEALAGEGEVHVVNSSSLTPAFALANAAEVCPLIYSDEYIPFLLQYCRDHRIGALLSLFDIDVPVLSAHASEFRALGVEPIVAPLQVARACNDKYLGQKLVVGAGVPALATYLSLGDAKRALAAGEVSFPLFVKPRWGMGSIGIYAAHCEEELEAMYRLVRAQVASSYVKYESCEDPDHAVLIQQAAAGEEYGMDVMCDLRGAFAGVSVRKKIAMRSGETDIAQVIEPPCEFVELARTLAQAAPHPGNMDVDVFAVQNDDGSYASLRVLEMNARFGGGYPFSHQAGVNLPKALVAWLRGEEPAPGLLAAHKPGLYMKDISVVQLG